MTGCFEDGLSEPLEVEVTAKGFKWHFLYPGADGQLNSSDDISTEQAFILPVETDIILILNSSDFIYTFSLPEFSAKEMAVPGLARKLEFRTKGKGIFRLEGDQMCGFSHESLFGDLKVQSVKQFQNSLKLSTKKSNSVSAEEKKKKST